MQNYQKTLPPFRRDILNGKDHLISVEKVYTPFENSVAPDEYTQYPSTVLSDEEFKKLMAQRAIQQGTRNFVERMTEIAEVKGAKVWYRKNPNDPDLVDIKVKFDPFSSTATTYLSNRSTKENTMNRPIYALTEDEALHKVSTNNEKIIIEEINNGFSEYEPSAPHPSQGATCYELYHKSSHDEQYVMHINDDDIIVKLTKYVPVYVLVKSSVMDYDRYNENGVIELDALSMIIDKEESIDSLYRYFEDNIVGQF